MKKPMRFSIFVLIGLLLQFMALMPVNAETKDKTCRDAFKYPFKSKDIEALGMYSISLTTSFLPSTITCGIYAIADNEVPAFNYAVVNHHGLTGELPRGGGPHLRALGALLGCDAGAPLAAMARKRYPAILPEHGGEAYHLLRGMQREIAFDPALVWRCGWV